MLKAAVTGSVLLHPLKPELPALSLKLIRKELKLRVLPLVVISLHSKVGTLLLSVSFTSPYC